MTDTTFSSYPKWLLACDDAITARQQADRAVRTLADRREPEVADIWEGGAEPAYSPTVGTVLSQRYTHLARRLMLLFGEGPDGAAEVEAITEEFRQMDAVARALMEGRK